jgi:hypothetical protein
MLACVLSRLALVLMLLSCAPLLAEDDSEFFEKRIRPILVDRCEVCHSTAKAKTSGGLALDTRDGWQKGGDSGGAVIVPGKPEESLLVKAVRYGDDGPQMPPKEKGGKLADAEIAAIVEWVSRGAPDPRIAAKRVGGMTPEEVKRWWSFQKVQLVQPPEVKNTSWLRGDMDRFILAKLEQQGFTPASPADRRTLIRRATFDLTGLPPTPAEVEAFVNDPDENAFAHVVDRLLASPAYGQRWARHWLDLVRYADFYDANPKTRTASCEITEAWRYRDWVVDALNDDLPYDQFIVHQIAGDTLPSPSGEEIYPAGLIATTFLTNGVWDRGDADKEKIVSDMADDNIDTVGKVFLGLTLGCARCHDHKFDPILTEDYYALAGIFYSSHILADLGAKGAEYVMNRTPLASAAVVAHRNEKLQQFAEVNGKIVELDKKSPRTPEEDATRTQLIDLRTKLQGELPPEPPLCIAMREGGQPGGLFPNMQDVPIHIRGSYTKLGPVAQRRMPKFLAGDSQPPIQSGSGRKELAAWVASPDNPLTARVIVNRVWQWHFGEGLVRTPSNYGKLGEPPSHPELLDYLATRFVAEGWSIKKLHRQIMLSGTYQQSSHAPHETVERDPENRWLSRFSARRLEAEAIRDAMLFVSGQLDVSPGGPAGDDFTIPRRSLYVQTARWDRGSYAILFDAANPDSSTEKRIVSTVAPQALLLLNHEYVLAQAKQLAQRLIRDVPSDEVARIQHAYQILLSRDATEAELTVARQVLGLSPDEATWADLAHVLLCSNEFVFVD